MRRLVAAAAFLLVMAACGGGDEPAADPASITSCEGLADAGIALLQDTIDLIDGLDGEALAALSEGTDLPPEFREIQERGDVMTARATEIGCSDEEMARLLAERAADLDSDSIFGQFILEGIKAGEGGFFDE